MEKLKFWKLGLAVLVMAVALAGCGGGGGGGAAAGPTPAPLTFTTTPLVGIGGTFGIAVAVNNAATSVQVVGQADTAGLDTRGVRWDVDAVTGIPVAPVTLDPIGAGTFSAAYAINNAGIAVGESASGADTVAAFWSADAIPVVTALPTAAGILAPSAAYGINNAGQIVGEATVGVTPHAVLWNDSVAAPVDLGLLVGGTASAAYFISDAGIVVGEADDATGIWAVAWRVSPAGDLVAGPVVLTPMTGHVAGIALGIDAAGQVVGESEDGVGAIHAALWTINTTTLATAGGVSLGAGGSANAINAVSRIAGQLETPVLAKVWDARFPALAPDNVFAVGVGPSQAFGINNANMVVGADGSQGFVAIPQ
jgi:probable HAF family extracellular repeat protein